LFAHPHTDIARQNSKALSRHSQGGALLPQYYLPTAIQPTGGDAYTLTLRTRLRNLWRTDADTRNLRSLTPAFSCYSPVTLCRAVAERATLGGTRTTLNRRVRARAHYRHGRRNVARTGAPGVGDYRRITPARDTVAFAILFPVPHRHRTAAHLQYHLFLRACI